MSPDRRRFLQFLAASPLLPHLSVHPLGAQQLTKPEDGLSVMDFEAAAKRALPPAHWGYMTSGVDDDVTLKANHEAFQHYRLRVRRLVDVSKPDLRTEIFGRRFSFAPADRSARSTMTESWRRRAPRRPSRRR